MTSFLPLPRLRALPFALAGALGAMAAPAHADHSLPTVEVNGVGRGGHGAERAGQREGEGAQARQG